MELWNHQDPQSPVRDVTIRAFHLGSNVPMRGLDFDCFLFCSLPGFLVNYTTVFLEALQRVGPMPHGLDALLGQMSLSDSSSSNSSNKTTVSL
jgi:hypothetical protein